jgi:hypothetical protein
MMEWQWEAQDFDALEKVAEQQENLARSIEMLVPHDSSIIKAAPKSILNSSTETPSKPPE